MIERHEGYLGNLDIIKIVAAVGIVFHHYQQMSSVKLGGSIEFYDGRFNFGYLVELFFVISGFLTEYTFKENKMFADWMMRKLKRYYPYAFIACLVCLGTAVIFTTITDEPLLNLNYDAPTIITSITLLHTGYIIEFSPAVNNPTWYLCVLTLCYLFYWLIHKLPWKKKWMLFVTVAILMIPIYYAVTHGYNNIPFIRLSNVRGYGSFFIGCTLCYSWRETPKKKLALMNIGLWIFAIIGFLVLGLSSWYVLTYFFFPAILISALLLPQIRHGMVKEAGAISFEVYLWHVPLYGLLLTVSMVLGLEVQHSYLSMITFCFLVWLVATGIYYGVERPIMKKLTTMRNGR